MCSLVLLVFVPPFTCQTSTPSLVLPPSHLPSSSSPTKLPLHHHCRTYFIMSALRLLFVQRRPQQRSTTPLSSPLSELPSPPHFVVLSPRNQDQEERLVSFEGRVEDGDALGADQRKEGRGEPQGFGSFRLGFEAEPSSPWSVSSFFSSFPSPLYTRLCVVELNRDKTSKLTPLVPSLPQPPILPGLDTTNPSPLPSTTCRPPSLFVGRLDP